MSLKALWWFMLVFGLVLCGGALGSWLFFPPGPVRWVMTLAFVTTGPPLLWLTWQRRAILRGSLEIQDGFRFSRTRVGPDSRVGDVSEPAELRETVIVSAVKKEGEGGDD